MSKDTNKDTGNNTNKKTSKKKDPYQPKNIVICCDGTGNEYGIKNTNAVKTFDSIVRDEGQIAFYDPGVGTFSCLGRMVGRKTGILLGQAFGYGLTQNIEDAYEYLMNNFKPGDKIFLFGFSRGAFTARLLADMIYRFGLLQKGSKNLIPYVSKYYKDETKGFGDSQECVKFRKDFKETFCHQECRPHFIGIWDTVRALGYLHGIKFHDSKLNPEVEFAYQAIAIDEKRRKFRENLWDESGKKVEGQKIEQVWFAGCHSDVGGWTSGPAKPSVLDKAQRLLEKALAKAWSILGRKTRPTCQRDREHGLPDIAFAWMMDMAEKHGLKREKEVGEENYEQDASGECHESITCLRLKPHWEEKLEQDASGKLHESRKGMWLLWLKEHREIPEGSRIHRSVIDRLVSEDLNGTREEYRPKNLLLEDIGVEYKPENLNEIKKKYEANGYEIVTNDTYENRYKA